jgi:hypothetical protein
MENLKKIDWFKWLIITLGVWLIIYPHPYTALVTLLVFVPLITLSIHGIIGRRPSISTLFNGVLNNQSCFSPVTHLFCSFFLIAIRVFIDYDTENLLVFMSVGLLSTIVLVILLFLTHKLADKEDDTAAPNYVILGLLLLFYSPTSMFAINCVYDNSEPKTYQVRVIGKTKSSIRSKGGSDYHLKVTSWTNDIDPVSIEVPSDKYYDVEEGDDVKVQVRNGLFGVGWYYIE